MICLRWNVNGCEEDGSEFLKQINKWDFDCDFDAASGKNGKV